MGSCVAIRSANSSIGRSAIGASKSLHYERSNHARLEQICLQAAGQTRFAVGDEGRQNSSRLRSAYTDERGYYAVVNAINRFLGVEQRPALQGDQDE